MGAHGPDRHEHRAGEHAAEELRSLRRTFAERRLSLRTMDTPLRLATAGAVASLVGAALLLALRDVGSTQVTLLPTDGVRTTLGRPLFEAALVLLALGLGYIAAGAVLAQRWVALLSMLAITFAIGYDTGVLGLGVHTPLPHWAYLATRGLLVVLWLIAAGATAWRRGRHGDADADRVLRTVLLVCFCAVFEGYLLVLRLASPTVNGLSVFPGSIEVIMSGLTIVTVPILTVAAVDFAEWGQLTGERLLALAPRERRAATVLRLAAPAAGAVGLLAWAWTTQPGRGWHEAVLLGKGVGLFAVFVAVLVLAGAAIRAHRQPWPATLNFAALFAVVAVNVWLIAIGVTLGQGQLKLTTPAEVSDAGTFSAAADVRSLPGPAGSTILVPAGWQAATVDGGDVLFSDRDPRYGLLKLLVVPPAPGSGTISQLGAQTGEGAPLGPVVTTGPVQQLRLHPKPPDTGFTVWIRTIPHSSSRFMVLGLQQGAHPDAGTRLLGAMVQSLRPSGTPVAHAPTEAEETPAGVAQANSDRAVVAGTTTALALSIVGLGLLAGPGRRWPSRVRAAILLFGAVTVASTLYLLDSFGRVLAGPTAHWPALGETGVLTGVGLLALIVLAVATRSRAAWARRAPHTLTGLLGGTLALRLLDELYTHALSASRVAVWGAVIVLVAVAWDVTMSGESLTNHASRLVPRSSRVLLFYGYIILLASAVVFYSGQRLLGSGARVTEVFFEPEATTQAGLFRLALPLLVLLFLLRTFGRSAPAEDGHPEPAPVDGGAAVAAAGELARS